MLLRSAQVARNDRKLAGARVAFDVALRDIGERTDHDVMAILGAQLRRHGLELAAEEHVEEQRLDEIVAVMAERDLGDALLACIAVQRAAPQARAQPAHRLAFRYHALHDPIGVLLDDVKGHAERRQVFGQHMRGKTRLLLIEIHRDELEVHRCAALQAQQQIKERVGILAARKADHHPIARSDHGVVLDRLADEAAQTRLQAPRGVGKIVRRQGGLHVHGGARCRHSRAKLYVALNPSQSASLQALQGRICTLRNSQTPG